MAGFSRMYCIGGLGGFMGADGINPLNALILVGDACIAFFPTYFRKCPSMDNVRKKTEWMKRLNFNLGNDEIPDEWSNLIKEVLPIFRKLNLFEANLIPLELNNYEIK